MKNTYKKQSGAVLVLSLIILSALTLFVLSGSRTVLLQEKMTSAVRDLRVSIEIAESGVKDAEADIKALIDVSSFSDTGAGGLYSEGNAPTDIFDPTIWGEETSTLAVTVISGKQARYFIEDLGEISSTNSSSVSVNGYGKAKDEDTVHLFRIVSRSLGTNGHTERIISCHYGKKF